MTYALGIDLGTTYSAAAVHRGDRAQIVELGTRSAAIPSVVFLRDDDTVLAGEAAQRRAVGEPRRVGREFKRRIGDTTPILLGGAPYSAEALTARLLASIVDQVADREGGPPHSIAVAHPANWGPYKTGLLDQAVRMAGLDTAALITEPEAAVRHYASHERVEPGSIIAVYDLGGGTFDAAILRKSEIGFEPLGRPEGIERLGGIDFDAAVLGHVVRALDGVVEALDQDDPGTLQALARLRQDCVEAKEALSSDTDVSIPVLLPNVQTEVRLTRAEFEAMIRPSLADSLAAMRRALASAGLTAEEVTAVLLVGGSSRIPLVAQLVSNEFGRPIAIDADPKHAIALGAALVAADSAAGEATRSPVEPVLAEPAPTAPVIVPHDGASVGLGADGERGAETPSTERLTPAMAATAPLPVGEPERSPRERSKVPIVAGAGLAVVLAAIGAFAITRGSGGSPDEALAADGTVTTVGDAPTTPSTIASEPTDPAVEPPPDTTVAAPVSAPAPAEPEAATTTAPPDTSPSTTMSTPALPAATPCPTDAERTACITDIAVDADGGLVATYVASGYVPELEPPDLHIHFYFDSVIDGDERNAGSEGTGGDWRLWDAPNPFTATGGEQGRTGYTLADAEALGADQLCSIVATANHAVFPGTGNCIDLP